MKHLYYSDLHPFQTTPTLSLSSFSPLYPFPFPLPISVPFLLLPPFYLCSFSPPILFSSPKPQILHKPSFPQSFLNYVSPQLYNFNFNPFNLLPSDKQRCTVTQQVANTHIGSWYTHFKYVYERCAHTQACVQLQVCTVHCHCSTHHYTPLPHDTQI